VTHNASRGQLLPMWALGIITMFGLMFLGLNYGNAIRWQIRAQNAAAVVSIQAERWNVMTSTLYASSVEEYRIRRLLDSLLYTIDQSGGCVGSLNPTDAAYSSLAFGTCNHTYNDLRVAYLRAVNRYGADLNDLNNVASLATYTGFKSDAASLLQTLQACSTVASSASPGPSPTPAATPAPSATISPTCGDTSFKYSFAPGGIAQQTNLNNVTQDAQQWQIAYGTTGAAASINAELFAPVEVDIVTCAVVPAIVPNFGPIHFKPYYAVGRAASADVMVEEDWLQPGTLFDTQRGSNALFQPDEPVTAVPSPQPSYNWYDVNYGGEQNTAYVNSGAFGFQFLRDDFEAQVGWWGGIPIRPFGGTLTLTGSQGAC
jgi:hypothetical protein